MQVSGASRYSHPSNKRTILREYKTLEKYNTDMYRTSYKLWKLMFKQTISFWVFEGLGLFSSSSTCNFDVSTKEEIDLVFKGGPGR